MEKENVRNVKILGLIFAIVSIIYAFYASCSQRGLYLDGSVFFIKILDKIANNDFSFYWDGNHPRFQVVCIGELPLFISGIWFHIQSKITLATIYSFSFFGIPLLGLWWNYELTKRTKEYAILFWNVFYCAVIALLFHIFSYVETIIGVPLQFVLLNYLFAKINYTKWDKIGIAFLLFMMFGIYEHTMIIGTLMFLSTFFIAFDVENPKSLLLKIIIGAGSLAAAVYTFIFSLLNKSEHSDFVRFLGEATDFWSRVFDMNLSVSVVTVVLLIIFLFKKKQLSTGLTIFISAIYVFLFMKMYSNLDIFLVPMWEQHLRSITCWAVPLIFFGIIFYKYKKWPSQKKLIERAYIPVLLCGITLTAWQIVHTYYWNQNIAYLKNELAACESVLYIPSEHAEISSYFNKHLRRYIWHGNYITTALALNKEYVVKTLPLHYDEEDNGSDNSFRYNLYAVPQRNIITVPYSMRIHIKNKFWDIENYAEALNKYNSDNNIRTNMPENIDDVDYP